MYRSAYYNPFNQSVFLRTWSTDGARIDTEVPFRPYLYVEREGATDAKSIFKTPLLKKTFKNSIDRRNFAQNATTHRLFYNLSPEQQFLIDTFKEENDKPDFAAHPLKVFYIDIETASFGSFPEPEHARDPINLITIYDSLTQKTYTWGLVEKYKPTSADITYKACRDEKELLISFIDFWKKDYCDVVSGWNILGFDVPYILNRCIKLFGEEFIHQLSPVGRVTSRTIFNANFGKEMTKWTIAGVGILDYLDLYKTFSIGERESYSLNYVSELELGEGKIQYNATSLAELSKTDWKTLVDYNIQDVHLLVKLEEKLKYVSIARLLAYKGCTNMEAALGKVAIVTGAVAVQAHRQGYIVPTFRIRGERESYQGGYVREPDRGLQTGIVTFDVNSLYPNSIITLNISPETKLGKIIDGDVDDTESSLTIKLTNGDCHSIPVAKLHKFLRKEQIALSKAGVLYSQKEKGVIPNLINKVYKERVEAKAQLQRLKKGTAKKDAKTLNEIEYLNTLQYTIKIFLNSIYGTFANKHSSLMDIDNAMSITVTGQHVAKAGSAIIDKFVSEKYGINQSVTKYGDTDSIFITIQPILDKFKIPIIEDGVVSSAVHKIVDEIDVHTNEAILEWARQELFSIDPRYVFKREAIADVGVFIQKKRYILHILDEEKNTVDKFKYVGIELVRSTTPKKVKELIEDITKTALLTKDIIETNRRYRESYDRFCNLEVDDIAQRTTLNNLAKYSSGSSLQKFQKKTPSHVKGAIAFNHLVEQLGLQGKYELLSEGQKIKKIYCSKNKYGLDAISYSTNLPLEFKLDVDKKQMFEKLVSKPVQSLYEAIDWRVPSLDKEVQTDLFALFGE